MASQTVPRRALFAANLSEVVRLVKVMKDGMSVADRNVEQLAGRNRFCLL